MRDYITLGTAPCGEECSQIGEENYLDRTYEESERFIAQLRNQFGNEPEGAKLKLKAFPHDFGLYHEVVCYYDDENEIAEEYAFTLEANLPEYWT